MISGQEQRKRQRAKNVALGLILLGLVVLFYLVTLVKMGTA
jgi:Zn-dependent membrane protease YugP